MHGHVRATHIESCDLVQFVGIGKKLRVHVNVSTGHGEPWGSMILAYLLLKVVLFIVLQEVSCHEADNQSGTQNYQENSCPRCENQLPSRRLLPTLVEWFICVDDIVVVVVGILLDDFETLDDSTMAITGLH